MLFRLVTGRRQCSGIISGIIGSASRWRQKRAMRCTISAYGVVSRENRHRNVSWRRNIINVSSVARSVSSGGMSGMKSGMACVVSAWQLYQWHVAAGIKSAINQHQDHSVVRL